MTSLSHRYPELGAPPAPMQHDSAVVEDELEDIQLASFEAGYQAGWDDSAKAQTTHTEQAVIDVAQNLQDMSFSHREAYLKLSASMKPLLSQIVEKLLPRAAHQFVGLHIVEQLNQLMAQHAETAVEIAVASDNVEELRQILKDRAQVPFTIVPDASLSGGQAQLRSSTGEQEINLDEVLAEISTAVAAFYDQTEKEHADD